MLQSAEEAASLGSAVSLEPRVILDDVEGWTTRWSALQELRRTCDIILAEVGPSELRSLIGLRERPPSLHAHGGEVWLLQPEAPIVRARWHELADEAEGGPEL